MTRRSISIVQRSGTTFTLCPPSIRPTERLGGPSTGSAGPLARADACSEGPRPPAPCDRSRCRPESGVELWQARPCVWTFQRTAPLWDVTTSSRVGSATMPRSARRPPEVSKSARWDEPDVGELLIHRAGHEDRRGTGRALRHQPGEGVQHRGQSPLDVTRAPAVQPIPVDAGIEWRDRHAVGRDGVLMGVPEEGSPWPVARRVVPGDDVVPSGRDGLPLEVHAQPSKMCFQEVGDAAFQGPGPLRGRPIGFTLGIATSCVNSSVTSSNGSTPGTVGSFPIAILTEPRRRVTPAPRGHALPIPVSSRTRIRPSSGPNPCVGARRQPGDRPCPHGERPAGGSGRPTGPGHPAAQGC